MNKSQQNIAALLHAAGRKVSIIDTSKMEDPTYPYVTPLSQNAWNPMKSLQTEFKKGEFYHKLVKREGDFAIYWRKAPYHAEAHYEVIVVQQHHARTFPNGESVSEREGYPSSEEWGKYGWTYNTLAEAEVRFKKLQDAAKNGGG